LYAPQTALRIRNDMNPPTPWPPDMATGENPPDGAIIDYYLGSGVSGVVSLEIADSKGQTVARFNSNDPVPAIDSRYPDPTLWVRAPRMLSAVPGHHRFLWDMQYPQVAGISTDPDENLATPYDTPPTSTAPWVMPGTYTVRLIVGGKTSSAPLNIAMDPRVKTPPIELEQQFTLAKSIYDELIHATNALQEIKVLREQLKARASQPPIASAEPSIESRLDAIAGSEGGMRGFGRGPAPPPSLGFLRAQLARLEHSIESADTAPTAAQVEACQTSIKSLLGLIEQWQQLKKTDLKALNEQLERQHLAVIDVDSSNDGRNQKDQVEIGDEE
jgi:hypothetical protein